MPECTCVIDFYRLIDKIDINQIKFTDFYRSIDTDFYRLTMSGLAHKQLNIKLFQFRTTHLNRLLMEMIEKLMFLCLVNIN